MPATKRRTFRDLPIRSKLLIGYVGVFLVAVSLGGAVLYLSVRRTLEQNIEAELRTSTQGILNMVRTAADASIRNHLRAVAEKNEEIVRHYWSEHKKGALDEQQAKERASEILRSQTIGKTGYTYCLDSRGVIQVHPNKSLVGEDLSEREFIRKQRQTRVGYIEYVWANPGEDRARDKAVYMAYFEPWDWIISVSSYREEFKELFSVDDLRSSILSMKFGRTGFPYIIDSTGTLIVHPRLEGKNLYQSTDSSGRKFIQEICRKKNGKITYPWKDPGEPKAREMLVIFDYIPELDWIVASSSYHEEFYEPLSAVGFTVLLILGVLVLLIIPTTWWLSRSITRPLDGLMAHFAEGADGDYSVRMEVTGGDEIGTLATYYNGFMQRLEEYSSSLELLVERRTIDLKLAKGEAEEARDEAEVARDEAEVARDEALEASQAKSRFLANMSHEIRTPMNAIIGLADLAMRVDLSPQVRDYLTKIRASSGSLLGIINDILDFSRVEAEKLELEHAPFDLREITSNLADLVSEAAHNKGIEFFVSMAEDVPCALIGDSLRLGQVLTNLANNAVKFTHEGEIVVQIECLGLDDNQARLHFIVRDSGIGIALDRVSELFDSFTQADGSMTRKYGGSGLGLAICKRLVSLMGGAGIQVESEEGLGSTFRFILDFERQSSAQELELLAPEAARGRRILVVDDNPTSREILVAMLETFSLRAHAVSSGEAALHELADADADDPYALVVLDWKMPQMDGIETARRIGADLQLSADIPKIIMVTAFGREEVRQQAEVANLDGFIHKPVNVSELFNQIMGVLGYEEAKVGRAVDSRKLAADAALQLHGAHILVAEDNELNQQVVGEILQSVGVTVTFANNGREAVDAVSNGSFDAVLMDVQMPEMDGFAATRAIREQLRFHDLPIIATTAHAITGDRERCLQEGMDEHVTKPIDASELVTTLAAQIPSPTERGISNSALPVVKIAQVQDHDSPLLPETLPGLHLPDALARLRGNQQTLRDILVSFGERYSQGAAELRAAWDGGALEDVRIKVHAMKGVSGNISATALQEVSRRLDDSLRRGATDEIPPLLDRFEHSLAEVVTSCRSLAPPDDPTQRGNEPASLDLSSVREELERLVLLLQQNNFAAKPLFRQIQAKLGSAPELTAVGEKIARFDAGGAKESLLKLAASQGIELGKGAA